MLNYVENFNRFLQGAILGLFTNYEINVHICMDEISICGSSNCPLDAHQAVFLATATTVLFSNIFTSMTTHKLGYMIN